MRARAKATVTQPRARANGSRSLDAILAKLEARYGKPRPPLSTKDPLDLLYWESVGYLVDDARRREAYDALVREVGTDPRRVATTPIARLAAVIERGGMLPETRARKVQRVAQIAWGLGGDLGAIAKLPAAKAKKALTRFPGIGDPGAAKILTFVGAHALVSFDSNGARALVRLGFGKDDPSYAKSYRSVLVAVEGELAGRPAKALARAHLLLRTHGQTLCTRNRPHCAECPLAEICPSFPA